MSEIVDPNTGEIQEKGLSFSLPGKVSRTGWHLPSNMSLEVWINCGKALLQVEGSVQWWLGDWWAYGNHTYGERIKALEADGPLASMNFQTLANYGWVANKVTSSVRTEALTWTHHLFVASLPPEEQRQWLDQAEFKGWSANELRAAIKQQAALDRTTQVEMDAQRLGKFTVIYADPPWRYEHAPMGGSNRSIENQYPTMDFDEICALPVNDIAHENSVLFMWATSPKLAECMKVLDAWGFTHRTTMVWVKDKIGMGYHARERHEILLIAKRGELPPPPAEARPDSVVTEPRLEHSAKPKIFYDLIDAMYPGLRKIELFGRAPDRRELWAAWGNQAEAA